MSRKITVREYATENNISVQAVHKKIKLSKIKNLVKLEKIGNMFILHLKY